MNSDSAYSSSTVVGLWSHSMLKHTKLFAALILSTVLSGCGLVGDVYQEESRRIINYLLADFPLPSDADIQKLPTVILGTGTGIAGRIVLYSELSPGRKLDILWQLHARVRLGFGLVYSGRGNYSCVHQRRAACHHRDSSSR